MFTTWQFLYDNVDLFLSFQTHRHNTIIQQYSPAHWPHLCPHNHKPLVVYQIHAALVMWSVLCVYDWLCFISLNHSHCICVHLFNFLSTLISIAFSSICSLLYLYDVNITVNNIIYMLRQFTANHIGSNPNTNLIILDNSQTLSTVLQFVQHKLKCFCISTCYVQSCNKLLHGFMEEAYS